MTIIRVLPSRPVLLSVVATIASLTVVAPLRTAAQTAITPDNLRDDHVREAMRAIVEELYDRKSATDFWEPGESVGHAQRGGWTALVTLALLHAGESYQDERLRDVIEYLETLEMGGTYAVAIRAHVWALLPPKFGPLLERDKRWLFQGFSDNAAGWNYEQQPYTTRRDNSITQYGSLALWEIAKRGLNVPARYWQMLEQRFLEMQLADGGWNYNGSGPATGSMTAAGLTVLFITQDYLHAKEAVKLGGPRKDANQAAIDRGLAWFDQRFTAETNPGRDTDFYYYLYGVERVGLASGYRFFGEHDWFREGAAELISRLCEWDPRTGRMRAYERTGGNPRAGEIDTVHLAFALLFLSRGRVPVAINKLSDESFAWNNRPRDVANITRWMSANSETGLNWQIVSIDTEPEQWLDAPLLYLASNEAPPWIISERELDSYLRRHEEYRAALHSGVADAAPPPLPSSQMEKLKRYLDLGGTLFAVAEGRSRSFTNAIERLGRAVHPEGEWRDLPEDHPAYRLYQPVRSQRVPLRGLSNGVRELIILSPATDFSEHFQGFARQMEHVFNAGMNTYLYASEKNRARPRLETHSLARGDEARVGSVPATITHVVHDGAWNAEPLALDVFSAWAWNNRGLDVTLRRRPLEQIGKSDASLVYVTGIEPVEFTEQEKEAIRKHVNEGGLILFETAGGTGRFTIDAERQMRDLFDRPVRSLLRHRVVSGEGVPGAEPLTRLEYRPFAVQRFGARETRPRLRGMTFDDEQARVLFSREDITHALLDQPSWGVAGYTPEWARRLLGNVVQYATTFDGAQ